MGDLGMGERSALGICGWADTYEKSSFIFARLITCTVCSRHSAECEDSKVPVTQFLPSWSCL